MKLVRAFERLCGGFFLHFYTKVYEFNDHEWFRGNEIVDGCFEPVRTLYYSVAKPGIDGKYRVINCQLRHVQADVTRPYSEWKRVISSSLSRQEAIQVLKDQDAVLANDYPSSWKQPFSKRHF
jgi:hypothetical protein